MLRAMMRAYSYIFHALLGFLLLGLALVSLVSGLPLNLGMLPWSGRPLTWWLLGLGFFALLSVALALAGRLRFLFFLWSVAAAVLMIRGFFLSPYNFPGADAFRNGVLLTLASLLAIVGASFQMRRGVRAR